MKFCSNIKKIKIISYLPFNKIICKANGAEINSDIVFVSVPI